MGDPVPEMKASVGAVADRPPATGWKCFDPETEEYLEDPSLTCNIFISSSPCCLTISLSGRAKQVQSKCEGEYKSTGLFKAGRLVKNRGRDSSIAYFFLPQVFAQEGASVCYLFVQNGSWAVCSDLNGNQMYIDSGSAGLRCPAAPESKVNRRLAEINDWGFNVGTEMGDFEEGGIVVKCSIHNQP